MESSELFYDFAISSTWVPGDPSLAEPFSPHACGKAFRGAGARREGDHTLWRENQKMFDDFLKRA
jgi:hypothetical protein